MHLNILRIATRNSPLALWQACYVRDRLMYYHPKLKIELLPIITTGDIIFDTPLSKIGGKRLFIKELELALLEYRADIAVHSMKDVSNYFPEGLGVIVLCQRDDPRDAFVSLYYSSIDELPIGAIVGTSSLRRQCQIKERRPDLIMRNLRGNINTRITKLNHGEYDAIILAIAGLKRLALENYVQMIIDPVDLLPAAGQGALGIECRLNDAITISLVSPLHHWQTALCISAERSVNAILDSNCQIPIGSYAIIDNHQQIWLRALICLPHTKSIIRGEARAPLIQAKTLGIELAKKLLDNTL